MSYLIHNILSYFFLIHIFLAFNHIELVPAILVTFNNMYLNEPAQIKIALIKSNSKRNRQLNRESSHLPFYERINYRSRNPITPNNKREVDAYEIVRSQNLLANEDQITLSEALIEKCKVAFSKCDINTDGFIDIDELSKALSKMGYIATDDELAQIMKDIDQNGDNKLDLLEFLRIIQRQKNKYVALTEKEKNEINIRKAWETLSESTIDKLNVESFTRLLKSFNLGIDTDLLVKNLDTDQSGIVDFEEFHRLFTETA